MTGIAKGTIFKTGTGYPERKKALLWSKQAA